MGLMDKVKAQVDSLAQQANAGMAKLDNLPVQRKSDALLRSLGVALLAERTGRGSQGTNSEMDRLITEITQHEAQNGIDLVQQAAQAAAQAQARAQLGQGSYAPGSYPQGPANPGSYPQGPGSYAQGAPPAPNQNVAGSMPGAGAGYGGYGAPSGSSFGGFPEPAPQPQQDQPQQDQPESPA